MKDIKEITKFIGESVDALLNESATNCRLKLDNRLAIFVGWSEGYGDEIRDDVIQLPDEPDWGINVGIKVWTSDDMWTDFDYINFPYYEDGDVLDMSISIDNSDKENGYKIIAKDLLQWYNEVKDLDIEEDGRIVGGEVEIDNEPEEVEVETNVEVEESCGEKQEVKESFSNCEYKDIIGEYFNYSVEFDFLDVVCETIERIDDFNNEEDIYEAIDSSLIYYSDRWSVLEYYCTPSEANWDNAYEEFVNDIYAICSRIKGENE